MKRSSAITCLLLVLFGLSSPHVKGATLEVGSGYTYSTIQAAIDDATAGDTIIVYAGAYPENIVVDKQLILTGDGDPVIESQDGSHVVRITANGCTFQGFSMTDAYSGSGINVESSDNVVAGNDVANSNNGIYLASGTSGNDLDGNTVSFTMMHGVYVDDSNSNEIHHNTVTATELEFGYGVYLGAGSEGNVVHHNDLDYASIYNAFDMNDPSSNTWYDAGTSEGNRYSDYAGVDEDPEDGIGDTPYDIDGPGSVQDLYPLMPLPPEEAPMIFGVSHSVHSSSSASIWWTTDQPTSDHKVVYSTSSDLSSPVETDMLYGTDSPGFTLTSLTESTTYYYKCVSYNGGDHGLYTESPDSAPYPSFATPRAPVTWHVDDDLVEYPGADYQTIQEAVDAAIAQDTIVVHEGDYTEDVVLDKRLTLTGVNYPHLFSTSSHAIHVQANGCTIETLNVTAGNSYDAIHIGTGTYPFAAGYDGTTITQCHLYDSLNGVHVAANSDDTTVDDCNVRRNGQGVYIYRGDGNTIVDTQVYKNGKGAVLESSDSNTVSYCFFVNNSAAYGLQVMVQYPHLSETSTGHLVEHTKFINNELWLEANVVNTVVTRNAFKVDSHPLTPVPFNYDGVTVGLDCSNIELSHNYFRGKITLLMGDHAGIVLDSISSCTLTNNTAKHMYKGVSLLNAKGVTMRDNTLYENSYNFHIDTYPAYSSPVDVAYYDHDIDTSNTVEGDAIHYYVDQNDLVINQVTAPDIGFLAVVNGQNIQIENLVLAKNSHGTLMVYVDGATVDGCFTWDNHMAGVSLVECQNVDVTSCSLKNNGDDESYGTDYSSTGLNILRGSGNTVTDCDASNNERIGIELVNTAGNTLSDCLVLNNGLDELVDGFRGMGVSMRGSTGNTVHTNQIKGEEINRQYYGAWLDSSTSGNTIYDNDFQNDINARDLGGEETWNIAKTPGDNIIGGPYLGGNHWSDYTGGDSDFDGLGDTDIPYTAGGDITVGGDSLPLTDNWIDDGQPPTINLLSPEDGETITKSWVEIEASSPDPDVDQWWYSLDSGPDTFFTPGEPSAIVSGLSEGQHVLDVYVDDVFDNQNHVQVSFRYSQPEPSSDGGPPPEPTLEQVPEEDARFEVTIKSPSETAYTARSINVVIEAPYTLNRASYRLNDGDDEKMKSLKATLSRLTIGTHRLVVSAESETGLLGRGEVTFTVVPLSLGELYRVGTPDYVDDASFTFNGRSVELELSFEARDVRSGDLSVYVNSYLTGTPGVDAGLTELYNGSVALADIPATDRWTAYSYTLDASMIVPDAENLVSFIHNRNPSRTVATMEWAVRNVTIRPLSTYEFPRVEVSCGPRAVGVDGYVQPTVRIEGVRDAAQYDLYLYVVTPNRTVLYYPGWKSDATALDDVYLRMNHYGTLPGWFTVHEGYARGTYRMVAKITRSGESAPVSISTSRFYYWNESSVKLFASREIYTDGDPIQVSYAVTTAEPFNGSLVLSLERPDETRVYLPAYDGLPYSTQLEPVERAYETVLEDTVDLSWEEGNYVVRASLFDDNGTKVGDDLLLLEVRREPFTIMGLFQTYNASERVMYSRLSLYEAATLGLVDSYETEGPQESYTLTAAPGSYFLAGEAVSDNGDFYCVGPHYVPYSYGGVVRQDILLANSTGKLETAGATQQEASLHAEAKQRNLLYFSGLSTMSDTPDSYLEIQDEGGGCPKPKVYVNAEIDATVLDALLQEYPGDDASTLKRYFTAKLANRLKLSNPELVISSYAEVLDGMQQMEALMWEGQETDMREVGQKLNAEYLLNLHFGNVGEVNLAHANLYDVDLVQAMDRHEVRASPEQALSSVTDYYVDLSDTITRWEASHPVPPRGPRVVISLSKPSVTPAQGENTLTMTATVTNCKGQPVEGLQVYFRDVGAAGSGRDLRGRVTPEIDVPGLYGYSVTDGDGVAQATYTLVRGVDPDNEKVDVFVVGRGGRKTHSPAEFPINGIGLKAWAEKPSLAPLEDTVVHVKLYKVEGGEEAPLAGKRVYYDGSMIKDSMLVPLGATENGLLVTDGLGESTLKFVAGEKEGEIGIGFTYDVGIDDPQFPGFMTGSKVTDKAIIEIKADEFLIKIQWSEEYKFNVRWGKLGYYDGQTTGFYRYGLSSNTVWERRGGKEDTEANLAYLFHGDFNEHITYVWLTCEGFDAQDRCNDWQLYSKEDYTTIAKDGHETGEFGGRTINAIFGKDAIGNIYLRVNPMMIPFTLDGYYKADGTHWWEEFMVLDELDDRGANIKVGIGGGSEPVTYNHDYGGARYHANPDLYGIDVMYRPNPDFHSIAPPWVDKTFIRGVIKIEKVGESTYRPFTYSYDNAFSGTGFHTSNDIEIRRSMLIQVVKR